MNVYSMASWRHGTQSVDLTRPYIVRPSAPLVEIIKEIVLWDLFGPPLSPPVPSRGIFCLKALESQVVDRSTVGPPAGIHDFFPWSPLHHPRGLTLGLASSVFLPDPSSLRPESSVRGYRPSSGSSGVRADMDDMGNRVFSCPLQFSSFVHDSRAPGDESRREWVQP